MKISKEHLLEWITADEAEKSKKKNLLSIYKSMCPNIILGLFGTTFLWIKTYNVAPIIFPFTNCFILSLSLFWILTPFLMWYISKYRKDIKMKEKLNKEELAYVKNIAEKTWKYFSEYMNKNENYLPPDNFQESRREKIVHRTSSTNIGLGLMTVISAYDLKFITLEKALLFLENMMDTILKLDKWNGHLYNWYNTLTLKPLIPKYISTVDSGNFIRIYVYN